jgi:hypothetical protein
LLANESLNASRALAGKHHARAVENAGLDFLIMMEQEDENEASVRSET